jgi:hypothetical protein
LTQIFTDSATQGEGRLTSIARNANPVRLGSVNRPYHSPGKERNDVGQKYNQSDYGRGDRRDQYCAGSDIFSVAHDRMKIWRRGVGQKLKRRIQRLGRPNNRNRQDNPAPFGARKPKEKSGANNCDSRDQMNPRIMLTTNHSPDTNDRVSKTSYAAGELKWPRRCRVF